MIELHGWLCIRETAEDEDLLPDGAETSIMAKVAKIIEGNTCGISMNYANGMPFLQTLFCANHRTDEVGEIIHIYQHISSVATGSYGMIYLHDNEDAAHFNSFVVYLFRRGHCGIHIDPYFSPCIPTIEDGEVFA
ncbi:MAG: hypothetical protein IK130_00455 [Oscillospiraceae bacterium]|nr:hypothetical protein [Oscillospiraceae bacterium]